MADQSFLSVVSEIKTPLALAAFAIAALLAVIQTRRGRGRDAMTLTVIGAIVLLGLVPLVTDSIVRVEANGGIYRVRVVARGPNRAPLEGARISTDALNEPKSTEHGATELAIPRGSLPKDGAVTIYASADGMKGATRLVLGEDLNPTVTIDLAPDRSASISGVVVDGDGNSLSDVVVSAGPGVSTRTDENGAFSVPGLGAEGAQIRLRFEHKGFKPADDFYAAGDAQVSVVLRR